MNLQRLVNRFRGPGDKYESARYNGVEVELFLMHARYGQPHGVWNVQSNGPQLELLFPSGRQGKILLKKTADNWLTTDGTAIEPQGRLERLDENGEVVYRPGETEFANNHLEVSVKNGELQIPCLTNQALFELAPTSKAKLKLVAADVACWIEAGPDRFRETGIILAYQELTQCLRDQHSPPQFVDMGLPQQLICALRLFRLAFRLSNIPRSSWSKTNWLADLEEQHPFGSGPPTGEQIVDWCEQVRDAAWQWGREQTFDASFHSGLLDKTIERRLVGSVRYSDGSGNHSWPIGHGRADVFRIFK